MVNVLCAVHEATLFTHWTQGRGHAARRERFRYCAGNRYTWKRALDACPVRVSMFTYLQEQTTFRQGGEVQWIHNVDDVKRRVPDIVRVARGLY